MKTKQEKKAALKFENEKLQDLYVKAQKLRASLRISQEKFEEIVKKIQNLAKNPVIKEQIDQEENLAKMLEHSQQSLQSLTTEQLEEISAYNNPPWRIKLAVEAIYFLMLGKVLTWEEIRKKMVDGFVDKVLKLNLDKIKPSVLREFKVKYIEQETWDLEKLKRASKAMGPFGEFLEFVTQYQNQQEKYDQLKDNQDVQLLRQLQRDKQMIEQEISDLEMKIKDIDDEVDEVRKRVNELESYEIKEDYALFDFKGIFIQSVKIQQTDQSIDCRFADEEVNDLKKEIEELKNKIEEMKNFKIDTNDQSVQCELMNDYVAERIKMVSPDLDLDKLKIGKPTYRFFDDRLLEKIKEIKDNFVKDTDDKDTQCNLIEEEIERHLQILTPPLEKRDSDEDKLKEKFIQKNNQILNYYDQKIEKLQNDQILPINQVNDYIRETYENKVKPFDSNSLPVENNSQIKLINKLIEIDNYYAQLPKSLSIKNVNKYLTENFEGKIAPIDKNHLDINDPNSEIRLINKMEDIREYQHNLDTNFYKNQMDSLTVSEQWESVEHRTRQGKDGKIYQETRRRSSFNTSN